MSPLGFVHRSSTRRPDRRRRASAARGIAAASLALLLAAWPAAAQETGTLTGTVTLARTGAPIASAQVYLEGTSTGTLTGENGRFVLLNVPAGQHVLVVERIGYSTARQDVTMTGGGSQALEFTLEEEALGLDELVVTGEAGQARRREVGNAISQLDLADVPEPPVSMEGMLQGRVPGLSITEASASAGSGSMIRLRGNVSIAMSNQPLIYVDGVRMRSEPYPKNMPPVGYSGRSANVTPTPINDIDPSSIERIEVIKGAAATTLYGTEASAGVIQIFTKQGTRGARAQWTAQVDQGFSWVKPFGTEAYPHLRLDPWMRGVPSWLGGGIEQSLVDEVNDEGNGPWEPEYPGTAHRQKYYLSATGGLEDMRYFVSGSWSDNKGVLPNDVEESLNLRGNFAFTPINNLNVQWNTGLALTSIQNTPSGNNAHGITLQAYRYNQNYVGGYLPQRIDSIIDYPINTDLMHLTTGLTATYQPSADFSHRLSVGYDRAENELRQLRPFGYILAPDGILSSQPWRGETITLDYAGNYNLDLTADIGSRISWGGQAVETEEASVDGYAEQFPGPGEPTLSSGGLSLSFENRIRTINAGVFGQARFDWQDRVFLTAGLRVDGNSAFGRDLGLQPYPKLSGSYVVSDEAWWPENLGDVKLRGAIGQAGRAPGAFDAVRTWDGIRLGNAPGLEPQNRGNAELGPERTTEVEAGFDGTFLDNRLTTTFTYYHQRTTDALLPVRTIPSEGGWANQLQNVGEMVNRGIEFDFNATVVQQRNTTLDLGASVSTNNSEMIDLGSAPAFSVGGDAWVQEGYPVPVMRGRIVTNPDDFAEPEIEEDQYIGPNQPTLILTPHGTLRYRGFALSAHGEYQAGMYLPDGPSANAIGRGVIYPYCATPDGNASQLIEDGDVEDLTAETRFLCNWSDTNGDRYIFPADFFKLRNVSLQIPLDRLVQVGNSPVLTLSAHNAMRWFNDEWFAFDPEMLGNTGAGDGESVLTRSLTEHVPPASTFTASLRINF